MSTLRCSVVVATALTLVFGLSAHLRADDGDSASLPAVHRILQQAAGGSPDAMPAPEQQKALLEQALKMIHDLPHVYHGQLKQATRDTEAAVGELAKGDPDHKARNDILEADDLIKSLLP